MKVLVIEDNAEIMNILEYLLKEEGHDVVSCVDGSCLSAMHTIMPDLVLLDELLPGIKGSTLCREIKAQQNTRHIPVLIISAVAGVNVIAAECGADGYIEKPFNIDAFVSMIKSYDNAA